MTPGQASASTQILILALDARHAAGAGGIEGKAPAVDLVAANKTIAVISRVDTAQGPDYSRQSLLPAAAPFQGHLLRLHRIHARQPAYPGLVKLDGLS